MMLSEPVTETGATKMMKSKQKKPQTNIQKKARKTKKILAYSKKPTQANFFFFSPFNCIQQWLVFTRVKTLIR